MKFGLPYQGSKNKIAQWVVDHLPSAEHLYDVFAGGCAVTHAALISGKFGCVHFSDINDSVALFRDCLEGNIPDGSEWISREEFFRRKDSDPYVRIVWSFGNNQRNYLYSREIEPYKKAVHEMIFAKTPNERRLKFREVCRLMASIECRPFDHESTERSQQITPPNCRHGHSICNTTRRGTEPARLQHEEGLQRFVPFYPGSTRCAWLTTATSKYSRTR